MPGIEVFPDIAPSDYHLFRSFSTGKAIRLEAEVVTALTEFFASNTPQWYQRGFECLVEKWLKVVENEGLYFAE